MNDNGGDATVAKDSNYELLQLRISFSEGCFRINNFYEGLTLISIFYCWFPEGLPANHRGAGGSGEGEERALNASFMRGMCHPTHPALCPAEAPRTSENQPDMCNPGGLKGRNSHSS